MESATIGRYRLNALSHKFYKRYGKGKGSFHQKLQDKCIVSRKKQLLRYYYDLFGRCLNEHKWFVVLFSAVTGLVFIAEANALGRLTLQFPETEVSLLYQERTLFLFLLSRIGPTSKHMYAVS